MRAKKPQTRQAGGTLAKALNSKLKQSVKLTAAKKRLLAAKLKTAQKFSATKKCIKVQHTKTGNKNDKPLLMDANTKKSAESNDKNVKQTNKEDNGEAGKSSSMGWNGSKEKPAVTKNVKVIKKTTTVTGSKAKANAKKPAISKEEKIIKSSKELKNLDIQICGYSSVAAALESTTSDSDTGIINTSICEIVKTKARAASSTFNISGNRSPTLAASLNTHTKPPAKIAADKSTKSESKNESTINKAEEKPKKVVEKKKPPPKPETKLENSDSKKKSTTIIKKKADGKPAETKSEQKGKESVPQVIKKTIKTDHDVAKAKKEPKVSEKIRDATNLAKTKPVKKEEPRDSVEGSIEIKTQIDESKSLIDTITEAINEVVKQYKDSTAGDKTEIKVESGKVVDNEQGISKSTKTAKATSGKIAKIIKKKLPTEKKLEKIRESSNLVEMDSIKSVPKRPNSALKAKSSKKTEKVMKNDTKAQTSSEQEEKSMKVSSQSGNDGVTTNTESLAESKSELNETEKAKAIPKKVKENLKPNKKKAALLKQKNNKPESLESSEPKGSKIIKIDLKTKKKVKPIAKAKVTLLKAIKKSIDSTVQKKDKISVRKIETMKPCAADESKPIKTEPKLKQEDLSDDDNMSLTELKAQLSDAKKWTKDGETDEAKSVEDKKQTADVKTSPTASIVSQKYNKKILQKTVFKASKKGGNELNKMSSVDAAKPKDKNDIYDFHESGHSSEDALDFSKKKKGVAQTSSPLAKPIQENSENKKGIIVKKDSDAKASTKKPKLIETAKTATKKPISTEKSKQLTTQSSKCKKVADKKIKPKENKKGKKVANYENDDKTDDDDDDDDKDSTYSSRTAIKKSFTENCKTSTDASESSSSDIEKADDKNGESDTSVKTRVNNRRKLAAKNRRMKLFGFYSGPKRHRMASLNALAKVQCLYENESRTAHELGFVKEPQNVQRLKNITETETHPEAAKEIEKVDVVQKKDKKTKTDSGGTKNVEVEKEETQVNSNRTLRKMPGIRGEGMLWEMEDSSLDESETEESNTLVSYYFNCTLIYTTD